MKTKPKVVIIDNNPLSLAMYAEEFPENWAKIENAIDKKEVIKFINAEQKPRCSYCNKPLINGMDSKTNKISQYIWICDCERFKKAHLKMMLG